MIPTLLLAATLGCAGSPADVPVEGATTTTPGAAPRADVVGVRAEGDDGALTFYVSIRSDETGCDRYADWWEVLSPDGALLFRRVLNHSHPDEQPFERSGGPVPVAADDEVIVRAHLHPQGYTGAAMRGTVAEGLTEVDLEPDFAADLAEAEPLPESCWF